MSSNIGIIIAREFNERVGKKEFCNHNPAHAGADAAPDGSSGSHNDAVDP